MPDDDDMFGQPVDEPDPSIIQDEALYEQGVEIIEPPPPPEVPDA